MKSRLQLGRLWQVGLIGAALTLPLLAVSLRLEAAPKKGLFGRREKAPTKTGLQVDPETLDSSDGTEPATPPVTVKLNHLQSTWAKVLQQYATAVNKEFVADVIPKGYFSRMDMQQHNPEQALRILNRELEPMGFRLLDKGRHLVLVETKKTRVDYQAAIISSPHAKQPAHSPDEDGVQLTSGEAPAKKRMQTHKIQPSQHEEEDTAAEPPAPRAAKKRAAPPAEEVAEEAPIAAEAGERSITNVRLKARDAVTVSRTMFSAFKGQAELIDEGPRGLQGFRVFRLVVDKQGNPLQTQGRRIERFSVGIDEERNQLAVDATPAETQAVIKLIRMLDRLPTPQQGTVKAVPTTKDAGHLAAVLQPELERLTDETRKASRRRGERGSRDSEELALAEEGEEAEIESQPDLRGRRGQAPVNEEEMEPEGDLPAGLAGSLKGDVSVEAVPDLGILIIRGNKADVESVMSVIKEIERLSIGATPEVELVLLQHVNSEGLASLLQNVYERLSPTRQRGQQGQAAQPSSVSVIPIVRPNAILIIAAKSEIEAVKDLAVQLDQPADPATEFRVFRLKHALPLQVVEMVEAIYTGGSGTGGQQQGQNQQQTTSASTQGLAPRVRIFADPRTNSVIVQARPRDMNEVAVLIRNLDSTESAAVSQIKIFPLKNAVSDELANTLQMAIQSVLNPARIIPQQGQGGQQQQTQAGGQGQVAAELREIKSQILQFIGKEGGEDTLLRSGILTDIRITSDARTNSIVVTAPDPSMELIGALIKQFDRPAAAIAEIKVFALANSDASSMQSLLERLFGVASTRQGQGGQGVGNQAAQTLLGLQVSGADDPSSTLIPLRFSTDARTNSIIAIGGAEALRVVEGVLLRLDISDIRQRQNNVYRLKNAPAADVANAIGQFLQTQRQTIQQVDPELISPFEQIEREVIVVAEPVTNSLLISATPRFYKDIMDLVRQLDTPPKQVLIQALLVEVSLDNADEWGVELGLQDSILFDRSLISQLVQLETTTTSPNGVQTTTQNLISQASTPGFLFNNQPLGNNTSPGLNTGRVGTQGLSNFNVGRINSDLGYGGFVFAAGSESVNVLLRALAARRRVDVLSRPQVRTLDNQLAQIQVGQEVPRVSSFTLNQQTGNATPLVQQRQVGIILTVTPRISPDGHVVMEVAARKDALSSQGVPLFLNPNGSTITSPIIDTTNALTTVAVKSGQTIVMGGMITKNNESIERKVPFVGDLPIIGNLFRYDFKRDRRTELIIFLTPRIIHSDAEAELFKEIETQRLNFIECEAEQLHGPLFGVQAEMDWDAVPPVDPLAPLNAPQPPEPNPTVPGLPMSHSVEDGEVPTTMMPAEPRQIPAMPEENLDIDLSQRRRKATESDIVPAEATTVSGKASVKQAGGSRSKANSSSNRKPAKGKARMATE